MIKPRKFGVNQQSLKVKLSATLQVFFYLRA